MDTLPVTLDGYLQEAPRYTVDPQGLAVLRWRLLLPVTDDQGDYSLVTCLMTDPHLDPDAMADAYPAGTYVQVTGELHLPGPGQPQLLLVAADLAPVDDPATEPMPTTVTVHQVLPVGPYTAASTTTDTGTWWHLWDRAGRYAGQANDPGLLSEVIARHHAAHGD